MATHLALNLTHDAIDLLHDTGAGWVTLGSARLDAPDFARKLAGLRATAAQIGGMEYHTLLVIPTSEILYTSASATGQGPEMDAERVRETLDGATPYAVSELVFDWFEQEERLRIAVVARETLAEAESFAEEHGFRPVGFTTLPPDTGFDAPPWFGATARAAEILPGGAERPAALTITGALSTPELEALIAERAPKPEPKPEPVPEPVSAPEAAPEAEAEPKPAAAEADAPKGTPAEEPVPAFSSRRAKAKPEAESAAEPAAEIEKQPKKRNVTRRKTAQPKADAQPPAADTPAPEAQEDAAPAFTSIRARKTATAEAPAKPPAPDLPPPPPVQAAPTAPRPSTTSAPATAPDPGALEGAARSLSARREDSAPTAKPKAKEAGLRTMFGSRKPAAPKAPAPLKPKVAEAEALTVFGARSGQQTAPADPGRGGLVITGGVILILLAVGLWAGVAYRDQVEAWLYGTPPLPEEVVALPPLMVPEPALPTPPAPERQADPQPPALEPEPEPPTAQITAPTVQPEAPPVAATLAPRPVPELAQPAPAPVPLPRAEPLPALALQRSAPTAPATTPPPQTALLEDEILLDDAEPEIVILSPEETRALYAATGIWQSAPEQPSSGMESEIERLYLAAIDPVVLGADPIDLPRDARRLRDTAVPRQAIPPRPGIDILLGADGLVTPTPGGTLNPDGILVYAGEPPLVPPRRPGLTDPPVATLTPDALAEFRPRQRPAGLAVEAERARFGGRTRAELAALRPLQRPQSVAEAAAALRAEAETLAAREADALAVKERAEAAAAGRAGASPLAISASLTPRARPAGLAPTPAAAPTTTASAGPAVQRSQRVTPQEATPVSVARQATETGLRLNRMNLIGVFGTPNDRRALVRLPSGRLLRLKVGDRLDGGRVATIDDDALRYSKGGREFTLEMPRG